MTCGSLLSRAPPPNTLSAFQNLGGIFNDIKIADERSYFSLITECHFETLVTILVHSKNFETNSKYPDGDYSDQENIGSKSDRIRLEQNY